MPLYAALLVATFWLDPKAPAAQQRNAWRILCPLAVAVTGAALWFAGLQFFVLKTICPYCMTAHACGLLASVLLLAKVPVQQPPEKARLRERQVFIPPSLVVRLGLAGAAAVGLLVLGQVLPEQKAFTSTPISAGVQTNPPPTFKTNQVALAREFQILDGEFKFTLTDVPLIGKSTASNLIVSLFDYTCHHCRAMHAPLMDAQERFSNALAIISLPLPLDPKCNPLMKRVFPDHTNACALARLGLTVWRANPKVARQFDDWIFAPARPPLPVEAEGFARQLVGSESFDRAARDPWVEERLQQDIALYEAIYRKFRKSAMPEVIIGTNLFSGVFTHDQLFATLADQFGLKTNDASTASHASPR